MERYLPMVDSRGFAVCFEDFNERGLLDQVLVVLCGEFSRTPRMNDGGNGGAARSMGTPGRDHWGDSMFCLIGGGGVKRRPDCRFHRIDSAPVPTAGR